MGAASYRPPTGGRARDGTWSGWNVGSGAAASCRIRDEERIEMPQIGDRDRVLSLYPASMFPADNKKNGCYRYGEVVYVHPLGRFYTVLYRNEQGNPLFRESFFAYGKRITP